LLHTFDKPRAAQAALGSPRRVTASLALGQWRGRPHAFVHADAASRVRDTAGHRQQTRSPGAAADCCS